MDTSSLSKGTSFDEAIHATGEGLSGGAEGIWVDSLCQTFTGRWKCTKLNYPSSVKFEKFDIQYTKIWCYIKKDVALFGHILEEPPATRNYWWADSLQHVMTPSRFSSEGGLNLIQSNSMPKVNCLVYPSEDSLICRTAQWWQLVTLKCELTVSWILQSMTLPNRNTM